jgi:hypothetical protein
MHCRWAVIFHPLARKRSVSASGDCILDDVHRVLRPGGTLAVAETRRDSDFIAASPLRELAESHGFEWRARRGPRWQFVATFRSTR